MEPSGGPLISDELFEQKKRFSRELLEEIKSDHKRQRSSNISVQVIGWAVAVIGVVLSVYGSVFAEREPGLVGLWTALWGPRGVQNIALSDLMRPSDSGQGKRGRTIYVFALDVSGSLLSDKVRQDDWNLFKAKIQGDGLQMCEGMESFRNDMNKLHLAQAQTCCYLKSMGEGDYVAIWKFGATASLISGHKVYKFTKDQITDEIPAFSYMYTKLMDPGNIPTPRSADYHVTNFEQLLDTLHEEYIEDHAFKQDELHLVIVSDFVHDIGAKDGLSYATSMQKIADRFHDMGRVRHAMFHLVAVAAGNQEVNSVIPIVEDAAGWYQYRFDSFDRPSTKSKSMPDFFYGFTRSPGVVKFYHMAGSSGALPVRLLWDGKIEIEKGSGLTVGLMTDVYSASDQDLAVYVAEGWPTKDCPPLEQVSFPENRGSSGREEMQTAILRPKGRQSFEVKRSRDYICVQPLSVEKERVYNYKLMLSRGGPESERSIYLVDVKFQKYLPPAAAWTLVVCVLACVFGVMYWAVTLQQPRGKQRAQSGRNTSH